MGHVEELRGIHHFKQKMLESVLDVEIDYWGFFFLNVGTAFSNGHHLEEEFSIKSKI